MSVTTPTSPQSWRPDQIAQFPAEDLIPDSLLLTAATKVGQVEGDAPSVRCPYVATDPDAGFVAEGTEITEGDPGLDEVVISTKKIASLVKVSREQVAQEGAAERIAHSMSRSIASKLNAAFLANEADPTGLLHVAGVETVGQLVDDLWALSDAVAEIEADGGQATNIICHPRDWGRLARIPAATDSNQSLLGDAAAAPARQLAGLPVAVSPAMAEGSVLVVDQDEVCAAYGNLLLARSEDAFFTSDSLAIRATLRAGWTVARPSRVKILTTGPTPGAEA